MASSIVKKPVRFWQRRTFWSKVVLALWFAWLALLLIACSDATPLLPLFMLVNAPFWLVLVALTGLVSGRRLIIGAALVTAFALGSLLSDWDFRLRCKLSESALRRFISEQQLPSAKDEGVAEMSALGDVTPRRVGLFWVDGFEHVDDMLLVRTSHSILDYFGIAYAPEGRTPEPRQGMYVYWHLYGNWYGYQFDA